MPVARRWLLEGQSTSCLPGCSICPEATPASTSAILDPCELIHYSFPFSFKPVSLILDRGNLSSSLGCPCHFLLFQSSHSRRSQRWIGYISGSRLLLEVCFLLEQLALHLGNFVHQIGFLDPHCFSIRHKLLQLSLFCLSQHSQFLLIRALNRPCYLFLFNGGSQLTFFTFSKVLQQTQDILVLLVLYLPIRLYASFQILCLLNERGCSQLSASTWSFLWRSVA